MIPAPMFVSSPMSASPMYERCGTFVPSPIREFLISTNVPAFARGLEHRAGAKVTERADEASGPIVGVDATACGPISAPAATLVAPRRTVNGWIDRRRARSSRSGRSTSSRVDDRDAGEHVRVVDPVAQSAAAAAASSTRVLTPSVSTGIGRDVHRDALAGSDEVADGVGEVELALRVVRLEPVERRPQRVGRGRRRSTS